MAPSPVNEREPPPKRSHPHRLERHADKMDSSAGKMGGSRDNFIALCLATNITIIETNQTLTHSLSLSLCLLGARSYKKDFSSTRYIFEFCGWRVVQDLLFHLFVSMFD